MAHTLGEIRKAIDVQTVTDVRKICDLFLKIAESNPEVVVAAMGDFARKRNPEGMVQFYKDNAEYLKKLFDYR